MLVLCGLLDIFESTEKGKPAEKRGRKATGLRALVYDSGAARNRNDRPRSFPYRIRGIPAELIPDQELN